MGKPFKYSKKDLDGVWDYHEKAGKLTKQLSDWMQAEHDKFFMEALLKDYDLHEGKKDIEMKDGMTTFEFAPVMRDNYIPNNTAFMVDVDKAGAVMGIAKAADDMVNQLCKVMKGKKWKVSYEKDDYQRLLKIYFDPPKVDTITFSGDIPF